MSTLDDITFATARDASLIDAWRRDPPSICVVPDKAAALLDVVAAVGLGVRHALIGGVAVGVLSGVARATPNTDLAVESGANRDRITAALTTAGFRFVGSFPHSLNFRHASGEPVQLAFDAAFDPMLTRAEHFDVRGTAVPIVRLDDLIAMKDRAAADPSRRASKRLRDSADAALLRGDIPDPDEGW